MKTDAVLEEERQTRAKVYARLRRRLLAAGLALNTVISLVWLATGSAATLKNWVQAWTASEWGLVAIVGSAVFLSYALLGLPLDYYAGFVLPHRFGQSTQTLAGWFRDQGLGLALAAALGLPLLEGLYWVLRTAGPVWWLWAAAGYSLVTVFVVVITPVVILPLFNKFVPLGEQHADLSARLAALAARAGTRISGIYRFDMSRRTRAANAALTGLGRTRRILLGDTLLDEFTADEIETVIAHELGHHVHRDIPLFLGFSSTASFAGLFLAAGVLDWGAARLQLAGPADIAALPLLALTLGAFGVAALPLNNGFSRWRERLADRYAVQATGKSGAFASALTRLANQNLAEVDPEPWVVFWLYSHPPIRDRLKAAGQFQR